MSSCWKKDTAKVMVNEMVSYIDKTKMPNKTEYNLFANPSSVSCQFLRRYGDIHPNLVSDLYPKMMVLPVLKSDKNPKKFKDLISKMQNRIPGIKTYSASCEPKSNKTRGRYIFQHLLKLCAQDEILLSEIADKLGADADLFKKYIELEKLDNYSLMFVPNISSILKMAMSLTVDVFVSLAKYLINSDRFKKQMQENNELRVVYLLWMFNLLDYPEVEVNDIYNLVSKVYFPVSKVRFCVELDTNDQDISKVSEINSLDDQSVGESECVCEDVSLDITDISEFNTNFNTHFNTHFNAQEDSNNNNSGRYIFLYGLGVGGVIGGIVLPYALGFGYLMSSAVGGAAGLGVSSRIGANFNSFVFRENIESINSEDQDNLINDNNIEIV
jgi:hypothetical protein